jgi:hypothetical protein
MGREAAGRKRGQRLPRRDWEVGFDNAVVARIRPTNRLAPAAAQVGLRGWSGADGGCHDLLGCRGARRDRRR